MLVTRSQNYLRSEMSRMLLTPSATLSESLLINDKADAEEAPQRPTELHSRAIPLAPSTIQARDANGKRL